MTSDLTEVDAPVRHRRDLVVDVQVPQLGLPRLFVRGEQTLETIEADDLLAAQAESARNGSDVASATSVRVAPERELARVSRMSHTRSTDLIG